jgi:hypothetical protein
VPLGPGAAERARPLGPRAASTSVAPMEVPAPDPSKLLQSWMEWERGEVTPGRVMANMKTGGLRRLLEELSNPDRAPSARPGDAASPAAPDAPEPAGGQPPTWAPVV